MNNKIWYIFDLNNIKKSTSQYENTDIIVVDINNFLQYEKHIEFCIKKFNEEIKWDKMWDINQAEARILNNHTLYIMIVDDDPMGFVWVHNFYLYNAFVSVKRKSNMSQWFIQNVLFDRNLRGYDVVKLYTEEWNLRAIRFWEKLGFKVMDI